MKKGLTFVFAMLLVWGTLATPTAALADPTISTLPGPTLTCSDGNSDVSLQVRIRNQGPGNLPTGTIISYSYKTSASGPTKSGTYKLDAPMKVGDVRSFNVTPLTHWNPPIYQCSAQVFKLKIIK